MSIGVDLIRDMPELGHRAGDSVIFDPLAPGQLHVVATISAYDFPQVLANLSPADASKALQMKSPDGFKSERRRTHKPRKKLRVEDGGAR